MMEEELQFDWTQQQELEAARAEGLDTAIMEDPRYLAHQMQEIRLGLEAGVEVSVYANPGFDWFQMEQIRLGMIEHMDVSPFAKMEYGYLTMKQLRLAWHDYINLDNYLKRGFIEEELEEIRLAIKEEISIDLWLMDNMRAEQIQEIRMGLSQDLDVSRYAKNDYNWLQMKEIRKGLEERLEVSLYAKPLFNHKQMQEIRLGLTEGLEVESYAKLIFTSRDMQQKRLMLLQAKAVKQESCIKQELDSGAIEELIQADISVLVEENGNKAFVFIPWESKLIVSKEQIQNSLTERGIIFGIDESMINQIIKRKMFNQKVLIAEGIKPVMGVDGYYEFFVRTNLPRIPAAMPDGSVNYADIDAFEMVEAEQEIARYHPAQKGKAGKNIFGEELAASKGSEMPTFKGSGFMLAPDRMTYLAKKSGKFEYENGTVNITSVLVIREDVTGVFGKIEVDGTVYVVGSVHSGAHIKASGDIIVEHNVEAGKLIAGGNILIKRGSRSKHECFVEAGGEVSGNFFEAADIIAVGNVKANHIMNSKISTSGKVIVSGSKGLILGGKVSAMKGIDTYNLGNVTNLQTSLDVGQNDSYHEAVSGLLKKKEKVSEEIFIFEEGAKRLMKQSSSGTTGSNMLHKIEVGIRMKQEELKEIEDRLAYLNTYTEKELNMPVVVRGKAYKGSFIAIDRMKYLLPQDIERVIFKRRNKNIVMLRI